MCQLTPLKTTLYSIRIMEKIDPQSLHNLIMLLLLYYQLNMPSKHAGSGSAQKWAGMIFAHWLASGLDLFGQNPTQSTRIKSRLSVEESNRVQKRVNANGSGLVAFCQNRAR